MENIEQYFQQLLSEHHSIDIAEAEFKKMIAEDDHLREAYKEWCHTVGSTERLGFRDYAEDYQQAMDEVWDALTDYDNEE